MDITHKLPGIHATALVQTGCGWLGQVSFCSSAQFAWKSLLCPFYVLVMVQIGIAITPSPHYDSPLLQNQNYLLLLFEVDKVPQHSSKLIKMVHCQ